MRFQSSTRIVPRKFSDASRRPNKILFAPAGFQGFAELHSLRDTHGFEERRLKMPVLETERLVLRKLDQKDLRDIIAWADYSTGQNAEVPAQEFPDYCFREYRERGIGPWGIQLKETKAVTGNCGFPHITFKKLRGEGNYYVAPRRRGQGLAPEGLKTLLKFGFKDIGLARIQFRCELDNLSSERVMQKARMSFDGWIEDTLSSIEPSRKQKLYVIRDKNF